MRSEVEPIDVAAIPFIGARPSAPELGGGPLRSFTPPRLHAVDPDATRRMPRLTVAELHLPAELVRARATHYTAVARANGAQHSMRLWRDAYEHAILGLARESVHLPANAPCQQLNWRQRDREYFVSVVFGASTERIVH